MMRTKQPRDAVCGNRHTAFGREGMHSMIRGVGLDLCEIARMEKLIADDRFLERYFTVEETCYIRAKGKRAAQTAAGIYAAKEAFCKAVGTGIVYDLKEIGISHDPAGTPYYDLSGKAGQAWQGDCFCLSITHDGGNAAAVCIREHRD